MKKWSKKKLALTIGGGTLLAALVIGGILYYIMNPSRNTVTVYSVDTLNNAEWFESESTLSGTITSQYIQEVYLSGAKDVKEVYVKEGDAVKEGDPLLKYDMDEEEIDLQLKELEIKSGEFEIQDLEAELEKLKKTKTVGALDPITKAFKGTSLSINVMAAEGDPEEGGEAAEEEPTTEKKEEPTTAKKEEATEAKTESKPETEKPEDINVTTEAAGDATDASESSEDTGSSEGTEVVNPEEGETQAPSEETVPAEVEQLKRKITSLDQKSAASGDGSSLDKAIIFNVRQGKEQTIPAESAGEGSDSTESTESTEAGNDTDSTIEGFIKGSVINELMNSKKYFIIREYASQEAFKDGKDPVNSITFTPDTQISKSLDDDNENYTIPYLQKILVKVTSLQIQASSTTVYRGSSYSYPVKVSGTNVKNVSLSWSVSGNQSEATIIKGGNLVVGGTEKAATITITVSACGVSDSLSLTVKKGKAGTAGTGMGTGAGAMGAGEGVTYTKEELKEAIEQKESEIAQAKQELAEAKIAYQEAQKELAHAVVKATVNGTVTKAYTAKEMPSDGSAVIVVKAEEGMYVKAEISEMLLDTIKVGGTITCTSWETNESYTAEVREVSDYPSSSTTGGGSNNPNSSCYPIMAYIADPGDLSNGDSVSITYSSQSMGTVAGDAIVLQKAYVRTDAGQSYVYKQGEDGRLVKQNVKIGSTVYGQYVEIAAGLSKEDYIAFPYGKNVTEGAKTELSDDENDIVY